MVALENTESIIGKIKKIHYKTDEVIIGTFQTKETKEEFKVIGHLMGVELNEIIEIEGEFHNHAKYGKQMKISHWQRPLPKGKEQVIAFLSSKLIKGCSPKKAVEIVDLLGENAIEIIYEEGQKAIASIKGLGKKRTESIVTSIRNTFEIQKVIKTLLGFGISTNISMKAYQKYKEQTLEIVTKNPYKLVELHLIDFLKADVIAQKVGIKPFSTQRIIACIDHVLKSMCREGGHCYVYEQELIQRCVFTLNHNIQNKKEHVTNFDVEQIVLALDADSKKIIIENTEYGNIVYPKYLYICENNVANKVLYLMNRNKKYRIPHNSLVYNVLEYQKKYEMILANKQRQFAYMAFNEPISILTGEAGTGKTTAIKLLITLYKSMFPKNKILIAAPTGRASRKAAEVTGLNATTIHRLIGCRGNEEPVFNEENPLNADLVIIDEFSMADIRLANLLFNAISERTTVILIGDTNQLPSVSEGNVLKDLINAGVPTIKLDEIFRQAQDSQIVMNAHRVNRGQPIYVDHSKNDMYFIELENIEDISNMILKSVSHFLNIGYSMDDILVLSPMKIGEAGVDYLNSQLQLLVNPPTEYKKEFVIGQRVFREGDKIMQTKNNESLDVYNGDLGTIQTITREFNSVSKEYEDVLYCNFMKRKVRLTKEEISDIQLGFATTIHKSQGGEAKVVIIPVTTHHYKMLARNLLYTGITRAKEVLVLIGTKKAMNIGIANNRIMQRNTRLAERINAKLPVSYQIQSSFS